MAQYAMGNPAFATGNDAMDSGLGSLASAFFPDPSKVASAGYYGAKTRESLVETQQKQGQLDARGQLQGMIAGVNNGAVPGLHPGSVTDPDGGTKQSGPAAADGSPAVPTITVPQIMERAAAAGYDSASAGHIASSVVAQMFARGVIDKNTYITMMTGAGNAAPLTAATEIAKQNIVTGEGARQFNLQPRTVTTADGKEIQITQGNFAGAAPGTYFGPREADTTTTTPYPGGPSIINRKLTSTGQIQADPELYRSEQAPVDYTDPNTGRLVTQRRSAAYPGGTVRLGAGESTPIQVAPTVGAPPVQSRRVFGDNQIVGDQTLTQQQMKPQVFINPADPSSVQLGRTSDVIAGGMSIPPQSLDAQQALNAAALSHFNFALDPNATPEQKAAIATQNIQQTVGATNLPAPRPPQEGNQFENLVDLETKRRFPPTGQAGQIDYDVVLHPDQRAKLINLANQLRAAPGRFRNDDNAALSEAFNRLQADGTIPKSVDRTKKLIEYTGPDSLTQGDNIRTLNFPLKGGGTTTRKVIQLGGPSVAGTVAAGSKPVPTPKPGTPPPGAIGPAPAGATEGYIGTNASTGQKAVVRGGWLYPVQ
jgi:hypothetical protein